MEIEFAFDLGCILPYTLQNIFPLLASTLTKWSFSEALVLTGSLKVPVPPKIIQNTSKKRHLMKGKMLMNKGNWIIMLKSLCCWCWTKISVVITLPNALLWKQKNTLFETSESNIMVNWQCALVSWQDPIWNLGQERLSRQISRGFKPIIHCHPTVPE